MNERDLRFVVEDLEVDVANWKRRAAEAQKLLAHGAATWEATIRDRDAWKARAETAEASSSKMIGPLTGGLTVSLRAVELALREFIPNNVDYDIHKNFECSEDEGVDTYPDLSVAFFYYLHKQASEVADPVDGSGDLDD